MVFDQAVISGESVPQTSKPDKTPESGKYAGSVPKIIWVVGIVVLALVGVSAFYLFVAG